MLRFALALKQKIHSTHPQSVRILADIKDFNTRSFPEDYEIFRFDP